MFINKSLFVSAVVIFTSLLGVSAANAQTQNPLARKCYTVASLQGSYAVVGTYGGNAAIALATRSYDGNGNLAGAAIVNEPVAGSATGARTIVIALQAGTYTVNCNGTGQFTRVLTANGVQTNQVDDFVITAAAVIGGQLVATTIVDAQQTPSAIIAGGIFLTRVHTRLPDYFN
jgi:hypothetical protein